MPSTPPAGTGLIAALQRATHRVARYLERKLAGLRLSQAEAHVLAHLAPAGGGTIADLHRGFGHRRSTLTSIIDRLEMRGLVTRSPDRADRRSVRVTLTPPGRRVARRVLHAVRRVETQAFGRVSAAAARGFWQTIDALEGSLQ
jgi:DNA-binding MarR family transcriptional regulator